MKIDRIETYQKFSQLKERWNALQTHSGKNCPFLSHKWFDAWWQSFGRDGEMKILYFSDEFDNPLGVAPLMVSDGVLCFMANHEVTDYCDFISNPLYRRDFYRKLGDYFLQDLGKWSRMEFINIPGNSPTLSEIPQWAGEVGILCEVEESEIVPHLTLPASYDKYIQSLGRKNRHELRRKIRKLEGLGDIRLERVTESEKASPVIEAFISLHKKSSPEKAKFWNKPGMSGFFSKLAALFFKEKGGEMPMLYAGNKLIAALLIIAGNSTVYFYNIAYDKEYSPVSPGIYLFDRAIQRAISHNKREADFLRGGEKYKYFFGAQDSKIYNLKLTVRAEKR